LVLDSIVVPPPCTAATWDASSAELCLATPQDDMNQRQLAGVLAAWSYLGAHAVALLDPDGRRIGTIDVTRAPWVDAAAQAEYRIADAETTAAFEAKLPRRGYTGAIVDVAKAFNADFDAVEKIHKPRIERVIADHPSSHRWAFEAYARIASLYDKLDAVLDATAPTYFTREQEEMMRSATENGMVEKVDELVDAVHEKWRAARKQWLDALEERMVGLYAAAAVLARQDGEWNPMVRLGVRRLSYFTLRFGDDRMRTLVQAEDDPTAPGSKLVYTLGMFLHFAPAAAELPGVRPPDGARSR
jgi:hypothetical protein